MFTQKLKNLASKTLNFVGKSTIRILIFLIIGLKPLLGPAHCKHPISCSQYAEIQLKTKPFFTAIWLIIKRLFSCNPFFDPK